MREYKQHISELAALEGFDPAAFAADSEHSQQLCDLVLSLALSFNDFHDLLVCHDIFNGAWPADEKTPTPELGEFNGITQHLFRVHLATLHEVLNLIADNAKALKEPSFEKVVAKMSADSREAWNKIVAAASGTGSDTTALTRFLLFARNKVAFHYDRKEIASGFRRAFVETANREPYVSRGETLARTRFYFADAAAQDYMRRKAEELGAPNSIVDALEFITSVTFALHQLVFTFIVARGCAWRAPRPAG